MDQRVRSSSGTGLEPTAATRVAFHEAGHAVAAWHYGLRIQSVSIKPSADGCDGSLRWFSHMKERQLSPLFGKFEHRLQLTLEAVVCFCGPLAEKRHGGTEGWSEGSRDDKQQIAEILAAVSWDELKNGTLYPAVQRQAELLMDIRWPLVTRCANELLLKETLSGTEVYRLPDGLASDERSMAFA